MRLGELRPCPVGASVTLAAGNVSSVAPVVVLNGGSSSGKSSIARCLQRLLGPTWMTLGVDDLLRALPGGDEVDGLIRVQADGGGPAGDAGSIEFGPDGSVAVGETSAAPRRPGTRVWPR
jgi:chloramphenicol 3-O-phosphotransferase